jgi:hypothetical protein
MPAANLYFSFSARDSIPGANIRYDGRMNRLLSTEELQKKKLELKARRKPLFDWYVKNPNDTSLVLEIKIVDDQIAECNQQIERQKATRN